MYFPINKPIKVNKGTTITISIWRLTKSFKVWYEWCVSVEDRVMGNHEDFAYTLCQSTSYQSDIHNANGETYWIGSII